MVACFALDKIGIACERARLPSLAAAPLALTTPDGAAVLVVSDEAEKYGVQAGQTAGAARALLPEVILLPYDREAYDAAVECVWDVYAIESDRVEPINPERCYVGLDGLVVDIPERVRWLAERIAPLIGVRLRVGIGRTKLIATEAAKQKGDAAMVIVPAQKEEADILGRIPLSVLPQVDRRTTERLRKLGIVTLSDIARLPPARFPQELRRIMPLLMQLARGHDSDPVRPTWPARKIERTHMFDEEETVEDVMQVDAAMRDLSCHLAKQLSSTGDFCREVTLVVELDDGHCLQEKEKRASPTAEAAALLRSARRLLARCKIDQPVRGLTLTASGLGTGSGVQLALLDGYQTSDGQLPHDRKRRLDACLRYIRSRYGVRAIVSGSLLRQARRIDLWTHSLTHMLDEPVVVATDRAGAPLRYWRKRDRGKARQVVRYFDRWRERRWFGDRAGEVMAYRVEAEPYQVAELHQLGVEWRLAGRFD